MRLKRAVLHLALAAVLTVFPANEPAAAEEPSGPIPKVVLASEVEWTKLNPARGDKSPRAGTLWGDRNGRGPTGFLFRPVDGFESPPHIHNVSYRGIVIRGLVHNDDPRADKMWMSSVSFWTQPKGSVHITAAKGADTMAYIEIEEGPYLVHPPEQEFESQEAPINVDASNLVWTDLACSQNSANAAKVAYLWCEPQAAKLNGTLLRLSSRFAGTIVVKSKTFHGVVIQGRLACGVPDTDEVKTLDPGSYFSSDTESAHPLTIVGEQDCIIYIRTRGKYDVNSK